MARHPVPRSLQLRETVSRLTFSRMDCIDLFAGVGGSTAGAEQAGHRVLWAANHWRLACEMHQRNHPHVAHACQDLQQVDWRLTPDHDILLGSPCCQGHTKARGTDLPHHDGSRATAWAIVSCAEIKRPAAIVVENVPEFAGWSLFGPWLSALESLGYRVRCAVVDAADCGVPQHRKRLFVLAGRNRVLRLPPMRPRPHIFASSIIDWSAPMGRRIRDLVPKSRARVKEGQREFGSRPFLVSYYGNSKGGRDIRRPIGTITTRARWALVKGDRIRMLTVDEIRKAMGFPLGYILPSRKADAIHLLGNAVPPPMVQYVLSHIQL